MNKKILITGSTDGIGLEAAKALRLQNHTVLLHGRNFLKLEQATTIVSELGDGNAVDSFLADLSDLNQVEAFTRVVSDKHDNLDVIINNAGIFRTSDTSAENELDIRFIVNTYAPYLLTKRLLPLLHSGSRVVNISSAAQAPVSIEALSGKKGIADQFNAYAQSKLALTMWSLAMAADFKESGVIFVAVNPGSLLATKMVQEGFGMEGKNIQTGTDILVRAALSPEFADASGQYYDNDSSQFSSPHPDALDPKKTDVIIRTIEEILSQRGHAFV